VSADHNLARKALTTYALSLGVLVAAVLVRWVLDPLLGDSLPLVTLFGAVAIAVWAGGYRPAGVVAILGYLACDFLFIEPRGHVISGDVQALVGLLAYFFTCLIIIGIGSVMRAARLRGGEREEMLRVTLASIGDAVITTDTQGRVTYLNAVASTLTGWTHRDAVGQQLDSVFRIVSEQSRAPAESPVLRALREGAIVGLANHTILIGRDGLERPIDDSAAPITDDQDRVIGCVLIFRDISERRRWEKDGADRLLSAGLLASIVESSDDAIISKSLDGTIRTWNAGAERIFGYSPAEAVGRHISLIIPPDRISEEDHIIARLRAGQRVDHFETERVRKDGGQILVSLTISPIRDAAGAVVGASKIARDITDRKRAGEERQKFVTLVENSTDFIGICDLDGVPIYVNPAGLELVGLDGIAEARRVRVSDFFFPEDRSTIMDDFFPSVIASGHGEIEVRFRNFRTQAARWMAYKVLVLADSDGRRSGFATVSQDITERRQLEVDLRKVAADLSDVDRRKNEFLATLAHELRNPLAPLRNSLELLKRAGSNETMRGQAIDTMDRQLNQLVRLVDDLLDWNRITHGRLELRKRPIEIAAVIQQAIESCRPLIEAAGHQVRVSVPDERIWLDADEARLTQVLANLVNNSCKYTDRGGHITLAARRDRDGVVVVVGDDGIGIPPSQLPHVFDMFMQIEPSDHRSQGGLGIGLTLARRLVQMHGGTIEASSPGEGLGSEFTVRLPTVSGRNGESDAKGATLDSSCAKIPASLRRVLVVDDNKDAATSLVMLLNATGHETWVAHDGQQAIEAVQKHRPDVVLLDIGLPVLNGYEVCRRVRQLPGGSGVIIVALTGWGQERDRNESREAGIDGHLVKPVRHDSLMALLNSLAQKASATPT
jgi:PAS domain S-box-containing protein